MERLTGADQLRDVGVIGAQVVHEQRYGAALQTSGLVDATEKFADRASGRACRKRHSDVANLIGDDRLEEALPQRGALGVNV